MDRMLYYSHSGLRYLVLLAGLGLLVYAAVGLFTRATPGRPLRIVGAVFAGLLHTQVLLGLLMVALGRYYPQLIGHIVLMLLAAVLAQVALSVNRRRPTPGWGLPLVAAAGGLGLIAAGVAAIGRGLFTTTAL
jgi:vacuolar-type H+-ATPase subunit I/STV1